MKIAVVVAAVAMAVVGASAPAAAASGQQEDRLVLKSFRVMSEQAPVGGDVRFRATYTSEQQAEFLCETDFGDGQVSDGPCDNIRHPYAQPGTYQITQTGRTTTGVVAVSTGSIVVVPDQGPISITATATLTAPRTILVHSDPASGYDLTRMRVFWGNGSYTSGYYPSMRDIDWVYAEPGTYVIKAEVFDSSGASAATNLTVEVA
ncbi:PKD domain-containing protein [Umezawaea endophytica]|uniref:PKD domain-containing protein n=1 Tax=Umezawaea endophytica TaxID=1654476 RepID=A0A9X2VMW9_9PSEU|nr:PKD domain-containing protein [Umezawaea endophytica]MCS7479450.1 PKD domain-containing protein [Umezawaea endophytica]